eukprot:gene23616-43383_t
MGLTKVKNASNDKYCNTYHGQWKASQQFASCPSGETIVSGGCERMKGK